MEIHQDKVAIGLYREWESLEERRKEITDLLVKLSQYPDSFKVTSGWSIYTLDKINPKAVEDLLHGELRIINTRMTEIEQLYKS